MNKNRCDFKSEFDCNKSSISFYYENWHSGEFRYVKSVGSLPDDPYDLTNENQAKEMWLKKYNEPMPESIYCLPAEVLSANCRVYDGEMVLTEAEKEHIYLCAYESDFTMDMLYLLLDGLKWRPLVPVDESDDGWLTIMIRGDFDCLYLAIVRSFLGMPELGNDLNSYFKALSNLVDSYRNKIRKSSVAAISV